MLCRGEVHEVAGFAVKPVDTTGRQGDAFSAALLARLAEMEFDLPDRAALEDAVRFAHAAAALCVTRYGAIPAMPRQEVERFLKERE